MTLTPLQQKVLERYLLYRDSTPTLGKLMAVAFPSHLWLILVIAVGCIAGHLYLDFTPPLIWYLVGMGTGTLFRDLGWFRVTVRLWPIFSQVLDYDKVEALLDE